MEFSNVISEINKFFIINQPKFLGGGDKEVERLEGLFKKSFPDELKEYIGTVLPEDNFYLSSIGNDICIYGFKQLSNIHEGYNYNPINGELIDSWDLNWFLVGDEGGDPIIVNLSLVNKDLQNCPVFQASHGEGEWNFHQISSSLPQFLLLATYIHYSMVGFDVDDPIIDEEDRFLLVDEVANWLLPRIKRCDPDFYKDWVGIFDNA